MLHSMLVAETRFAVMTNGLKPPKLLRNNIIISLFLLTKLPKTQ